MPTLPALAVIRRLADPAGAPFAPGARPCVGVLSLAAIKVEMARHRIRTSLVLVHPEPLFARACQGFHAHARADPKAARRPRGIALSGQTRVDRGKGLIVLLVAVLFGLPAAMEAGPVRVAILPDGRGGKRWLRRFGARSFASHLSPAPSGEESRRLC